MTNSPRRSPGRSRWELPLLALLPLLLGACMPTGWSLGWPADETAPSTEADAGGEGQPATRPGSVPGPSAYPGPSATLTPRPTPSDPPTPAPTATPSVAPTDSDTPTPSPTPTPRTEPSGLIVDDEGGQIFASQEVDGELRLLRYRTVDGKLVDSEPLREGEQLLGIDEAGRLHLRQPEIGLRVIDAEDYETIAEMPLPTTGVSNVMRSGSYGSGPPAPLLDRARSRVYTFDQATVRVADPIAGAVVEEYALPPDEGPITAAALSADGRHLYVALTEHRFPTASSLFALDTRDGSVVDRTDFGLALHTMTSFGDHLLASGSWPAYGGMGHFMQHWSAGRPVRLQTSGWSLHGGVYDSTRNRIVLPGEPIGVYDAATMSPTLFASSCDACRLEAYAATRDRIFGRGGDPAQLEIFDPSSLAADPVRPREAVSVTAVVPMQVHRPAHETLGEPPLVTGYLRPSPTPTRKASGEASPEREAEHGGWRDPPDVVSRDGGQTWELDDRPWVAGWPHCTALSPAFRDDRTIFGCSPGKGVFRSQDAGRSWAPIGTGIDSLKLREIALSPAFAEDRTLFAASFDGYGDPLVHWTELPEGEPTATPRPARDTSWRSEDGGETWTPMGHYATLAVDPAFRDNDRIWAFDHRGSVLHVSGDAGRSWEAHGRLPELGDERYVANRLWILPATGDDPKVLLALASSQEPPTMAMLPKWPTLSSRLFRSVDDGRSWDLAWPVGDEIDWSGLSLGFEAPVGLMGPATGPDGPVWLFDPGFGVLLQSRDGRRWTSRYLPSVPTGKVMGLREDGSMIVRVYRASRFASVPMEALRDGPDEPPWERQQP